MEPIVVEFEVEATTGHAFHVWTERGAVWWPRSHTVTGDPDLQIVFEPRPGGRIYERAVGGTEHDWGEILVWDPPHRVTYLWHLFFDRGLATEITVTFDAVDEGRSLVRLVQSGFEALGDEVGPERRRRTSLAWSEITPRYQQCFDQPIP